MRWLIFSIAAFVFLVLELGLRPLFVSDPASMVSPSFMLILLVYVGFFTPPMTLAWAAITLGLLLDLSRTWPLVSDATLPQMAEILGPHALAYLLGAYVTLKLRAMVFRESPFTLAVVVFFVGITVSLALVFILRVRGTIGWAEPIAHWSTAQQLQDRFLQILYTAVLAIPVGWILSKMHRLFGFQAGKSLHW